jgi:hypothetical protein
MGKSPIPKNYFSEGKYEEFKRNEDRKWNKFYYDIKEKYL